MTTDMVTIFGDRYIGKLDLDKEQSASGRGSNLENTQAIPGILRQVIKDYSIESLLDAPCGDLHWMRHIIESLNVKYIGIDVVPKLVKRNKEFFPDLKFYCRDITQDKLPQADLILCRDGLVHHTKDDIFKALENFKRSRSTYLLTTTFTRNRQFVDIETGDWRPINFELPPFNLKSLDVFPKYYSDPAFSDKSLGLFMLNDTKNNA